jgi:hypothetical protein
MPGGNSFPDEPSLHVGEGHYDGVDFTSLIKGLELIHRNVAFGGHKLFPLL